MEEMKLQQHRYFYTKQQYAVSKRKRVSVPSLGATARLLWWAIVLASIAGARCSAQDTIPDSQVEANVLKALAGASNLASRNITTNTVYGVVTLIGNVPDEAARTKADNLAANAPGVKKVVDELQVGPAGPVQNVDATENTSAAQSTSAAANTSADQAGPGMVLQSDGTYAPAQSGDASGLPAAGTAPESGAAMNDPDHDQAAYSQPPNAQGGAGQQSANGAPAYSQGSQRNYPQQPQGGYPQSNYPPRNGYPENGRAQNGAAQPWGGQVAGQPVEVPVGTMIRVRVNRLLASDRLNAGDHFDGLIANDVTGGGFVAIPRGAAVQGVVVNAKSSGAISGRGELSLQLTSIAMGGKIYPVTSGIWVVGQTRPARRFQTPRAWESSGH